MSIMKFDEWIRSVCFQAPPPECEELARSAWNAAIVAADQVIESADHNDDDSGLGANCNAMIAVEKLRAEPPEDM